MSDKNTTPMGMAEAYIKEKYPDLYMDQVSEVVMSDSKDVTSIYVELKKQGIKITKSDYESLLKSDAIPRRNKVKEYLENVEFNGFGHIQERLSFVKLEDETMRPYFIDDFKKHIIRTVAQVFDNRLPNRYVFVLVCPTENNGKSTFFRTMNPFYNQEQTYYAESIDFKHAANELSKRFMINIEELAELNKNDHEMIKRHISSAGDDVRVYYTQMYERRERVASLFATTNRDKFLPPGENTRWIIYRIESINFDYYNLRTGKIRVDMNDFWGEAVQLFKDNADMDPSSEEIRRYISTNLNYLYETNASMYIQSDLRPSYNYDFIATPTEVTDLINKLHPRAMMKPTQVGMALKALGWNSVDHSGTKQYYLELNHSDPNRHESVKERLNNIEEAEIRKYNTY